MRDYRGRKGIREERSKVVFAMTGNAGPAICRNKS
jgi:hypothetical protein